MLRVAGWRSGFVGHGAVATAHSVEPARAQSFAAAPLRMQAPAWLGNRARMNDVVANHVVF